MTTQTDQLASSPETTAAQKKLLQLNNNRNQVSPPGTPARSALFSQRQAGQFCGAVLRDITHTRPRHMRRARDIPAAQWRYSLGWGDTNGCI